jgi:hypothetical protein
MSIRVDSSIIRQVASQKRRIVSLTGGTICPLASAHRVKVQNATIYVSARAIESGKLRLFETRPGELIAQQIFAKRRLIPLGNGTSPPPPPIVGGFSFQHFENGCGSLV